MASLKQMQLFIDTNVQTGSFMIIVTYSTQSEHTRASTHERAHTNGHTKVAHTSRHTQMGTYKPAHTPKHTQVVSPGRWALHGPI